MRFPIPSNARQNEDLFIEYFKRVFTGTQRNVLLNMIQKVNDAQQTTQIDYVSIFSKEKKINWVERDFTKSRIQKTMEPSFFIPTPFDASRCSNTETTLHTSVQELCASSKTQEQILSMNTKDLHDMLTTRTMVAFGTPKMYRIYEIQELQEAWNAFDSFVIPERIGTPSQSTFGSESIVHLQNLLLLEYHKSVADPLLQCIRDITECTALEKQQLRYFKSQFLQFEEKKQQDIQEYLEWVFTIALLMRGWKMGDKEYCLSKSSCKRLYEEDEFKLVAVMEQLRYFCGNLSRDVLVWINKLPLIQVAPLKLAAIDEESESESADEHEEEEELERKNQKFKTNESSRNDLLQQLTNHPLVCDRIRIRFPKIDSKVDMDHKYSRVPYSNLQVSDCKIFSYNKLEETLRNIRKEACYRSESRTLLHTAGFFLYFLFGLELPNFALQSVQHIY
jgi:hypothetical protein